MAGDRRPILVVRGLDVEFDTNDGVVRAVKGIDLQVRAGEIFGFLGPNGAGKTTTFKMLVGLLRPSGGTARIGGHDIQREPIAAKSLIGYVPDQPYLPEKLTAREFLQFIAGLYQVDPAAARRYTAPDLRIRFTGNREMRDPAECTAFNQSRYRWVRKRIERTETVSAITAPLDAE